MRRFKTCQKLATLFKSQCFTLCISLSICGMAHASNNTRVSLPNALTFEIGGRSLNYSFNFDRVLSDELSVGVGYGTFTTQGGIYSSPSSGVVPVYANYYFSREAGSLYVTAGAAILTSNNSGQTTQLGNLQLSSSSLLGSAGVGYEYRSDPGFLVRMTGYLMMSGNIVPWAGMSLGFSF
jgi:hypothetical protein